MDDMEASPMGGQEMAEPAETAGTELCIKIAADGSMTVYKDTGDGQGEQTAQPAPGIGEALKMVLALYKGLTAGQGASQQQAGFDAA